MARSPRELGGKQAAIAGIWHQQKISNPSEDRLLKFAEYVVGRRALESVEFALQGF